MDCSLRVFGGRLHMEMKGETKYVSVEEKKK